jgi:hypothetical protein
MLCPKNEIRSAGMKDSRTSDLGGPDILRGNFLGATISTFDSARNRFDILCLVTLIRSYLTMTPERGGTAS